MLFNLAFTAAILSVIPIILSAPLHQILPETRSLNTVRSKSNAPSLVPRSTYDRRWNINNPKGPVRRSGSAGSKRASGKDSSGSSSSSSDSSSVTTTGWVVVSDSTGTQLGYLAPSFSETGGLLDNLTYSKDGAMIVSFTADVIGGTGGVPNVTLEINNPPDFLAQYPYLAAVESDLNAGSGDLELSNSDNFAYFSLSAADVPNGPAQIFESAISDLQGEYVSSATYYAEETNLWQYNFQYGTLDAIWVESTGNIVYASTVATSGEIYFTGNATEFISLYGGEEYFLSIATIDTSS